MLELLRSPETLLGHVIDLGGGNTVTLEGVSIDDLP